MLTLAAAAALATLPSPQFTWAVSSANGTAVLTQTALPDDACALRCEVKGKEMWSQGAQACLGRATDFVFPADDCAGALLLLEYPLRAVRTEDTPAAASLTATGTPPVVSTKHFRLQELVDVSRLRGEGRRVRWLAGAVGEPGDKPHFDATGTGIEFATTEGTKRTVRFGEELALKRAKAPEARPEGKGLYQYIGADGSTQFAMGLEQVPKKYRKSAVRMDSEIDPVERPAVKASPARTEPGPVDDSVWSNLPPRMPERPPTFLPPPSVPSAKPKSASDCPIFGLSGAACQSVLHGTAQQRRSDGSLIIPITPPLPPAEPPKPPASPYVAPPSPYK